MPVETRTETWRGLMVAVYPDGRRVAMEREAIIVSDVRDTILGPIDFGHTRLLPWRFVELETLPTPVPVDRPTPWWRRFWRAPTSAGQSLAPVDFLNTKKVQP